VGVGGGQQWTSVVRFYGRVTLKLSVCVIVKLWYILDWINEVPHDRSGTLACEQAPGEDGKKKFGEQETKE